MKQNFVISVSRENYSKLYDMVLELRRKSHIEGEFDNVSFNDVITILLKEKTDKELI